MPFRCRLGVGCFLLGVRGCFYGQKWFQICHCQVRELHINKLSCSDTIDAVLCGSEMFRSLDTVHVVLGGPESAFVDAPALHVGDIHGTKEQNTLAHG